MAKVLIVDDHPITRGGLTVLVDRESDLEICGEACDIDDALHLIESTTPDIAVVDISLETGNGIELVKEKTYSELCLGMDGTIPSRCACGAGSIHASISRLAGQSFCRN